MKRFALRLLLVAPLLAAASATAPAAARLARTAPLIGPEKIQRETSVGTANTRPAGHAAEVRRMVRALEDRYHSANTLKAVFLERYSEGGRVVRVESGTVYFSRPGRMRWEYESPEPKLFVADGRTVWFYVPADRTVSRAKMKESEDWRTPLALLTGKTKLSRLCSRIELAEAGERVIAPTDGDVVLRCLPRGTANGSAARGTRPTFTSRHTAALGAAAGSETGDFLEVFLEVNPSTAELSRVVVRGAAGVEMEFRFGNWQRNPPLAESLFHFQAPVGVAIVEE